MVVKRELKKDYRLRGIAFDGWAESRERGKMREAVLSGKSKQYVFLTIDILDRARARSVLGQSFVVLSRATRFFFFFIRVKKNVCV